MFFKTLIAWATKHLNILLLSIILYIIVFFSLIQSGTITPFKHDYSSLVFPKREFYVDPRKAIIIENYDKFNCDKDALYSNEVLVCNVYMKQRMDSNIDNLIEFHINNSIRDPNSPEVDGYFGCVRGNGDYTIFRCTSAPFNYEKGKYILDLKIVDTIYKNVKTIEVL